MELVTVAGRRFATRYGRGPAPTVVFETGLGAESAEWAPLAAAVEPGNGTFFADRLNRGDSDRVDGVRTSRDMAADLRAVLDAADVPPPYVLVSHSFGAHVVLAFANEAADVAAVVLVEPTHPRQFDVFGPRMSEGEMREFWTEGWRRTDTTAEQIDLPASFAHTRQCTLGSVPLVVLCAESTMGPGRQDVQQLWIDMSRDWLEVSERADHEVVSGSGHFMQRDRPDAIVAAIEGMLAELR